MFSSKKLSFISGVVCGLSFAPILCTIGIYSLSLLCWQIYNAESRKEATIYGYFFGLGLYITTLYWISFALITYLEQFWWAIPFALLGIPGFLSLFSSIHAGISWQFKNHTAYHLIFCCVWIFIEWLLSWIFTGFPWIMMGYTFSISDILIQTASILGVLGLSFISIYIGSSFYSMNCIGARLILSATLIISMIVFGHKRLQNNPTQFRDLTARIVQPSIIQKSKWDPYLFWKNLAQHIELSKKPGSPDIILWSEAALTMPYYYPNVKKVLQSTFFQKKQILITGGISDNRTSIYSNTEEEYKIYSSLIGFNNNLEVLFIYNKSHLVPFGEYMPFGKSIVERMMNGLTSLSRGSRKSVFIKSFGIHIHPLICYESIFSEEVRTDDTKLDIIINVTNDAWYYNSSGPYQHFEISRMRSVENGIPMLRVGNNGISAVIDPLGRVIKKLKLNNIGIIDSKIPIRLTDATLYSSWRNTGVLILILLISIINLNFIRLRV